MVMVDNGKGVMVPEEYLKNGTPDLHSTVNPIVNISQPAPNNSNPSQPATTPAQQQQQSQQQTIIDKEASAGQGNMSDEQWQYVLQKTSKPLVATLTETSGKPSVNIATSDNTITYQDAYNEYASRYGSSAASQATYGEIAQSTNKPIGISISKADLPYSNDMDTLSNGKDISRVNRLTNGDIAYEAQTGDDVNTKIDSSIGTNSSLTELDRLKLGLMAGPITTNEQPVNSVLASLTNSSNKINYGGRSQNQDAYLITNPYTGTQSIVTHTGEIYTGYTDVNKSFDSGGYVSNGGLPSGTTIGGIDISVLYSSSNRVNKSNISNLDINRDMGQYGEITPINRNNNGSVLDFVFPSVQASQMDAEGNIIKESNPSVFNYIPDLFGTASRGGAGIALNVSKDVLSTQGSNIIKGINDLAGPVVYLNDVGYRDPLHLYDAYSTVIPNTDTWMANKTNELNTGFSGIMSGANTRYNQNMDLAVSQGAPKQIVDTARSGYDFVGMQALPSWERGLTSSVQGIGLAGSGLGKLVTGVGLMGEMNVQDLLSGRSYDKQVLGKDYTGVPIVPVGSNVGSGLIRSITGGPVGEPTQPVLVGVEYGTPTEETIVNPDGSTTVKTSTPYTEKYESKQKVVPNLGENLLNTGTGITGEFTSDPISATGRNIVPLIILGGVFGKTGRGKTIGKSELTSPDINADMDIFSEPGFVNEKGNINPGEVKVSDVYSTTVYKPSKSVFKTDEYGYANGHPSKNIGGDINEIIGGFKDVGNTIIKTGKDSIGYTSIGVGPGIGSEIAGKYSGKTDEITINKNINNNIINELVLPGNKVTNKDVTDYNTDFLAKYGFNPGNSYGNKVTNSNINKNIYGNIKSDETVYGNKNKTENVFDYYYKTDYYYGNSTKNKSASSSFKPLLFGLGNAGGGGFLNGKRRAMKNTRNKTGNLPKLIGLTTSKNKKNKKNKNSRIFKGLL